ncbi:MAG: hypothetical protein IKM26_08610 [Clostridia bacterium]|nr:hypothetical protein [Clostridia bacterium]
MKEHLITRRQFLKLTGKGLAAAVFAGSLAQVSLPKAAAENEIISVNSLVKGPKEMRVVFLERLSDKKSDAFYITCTDENGMELYLVDGGLATGKCMMELNNLRKEILKKAGLESENKNKNYKLDVHLLISHFHSDHVRELSNGLISHKYMRMLSAYYPAPTVLDQSGVYDNSKNSDIDDRAGVLSTLNRCWPDAEQHEIGFGDTYIVDTNIGELKLFASDMDWGTPENAKYTEEVYYPTDLAARRSDMPVAVVNCNCLWMRFAFAGHSVLFTGDTMKKKTDVHDEPLDRFIAYYGGEALKSDIIKYPHHGLSRNPAARPIKDHLITDHDMACCILTGHKAGKSAGAALDNAGVKWYDIDSGSVVYTLTEDGISKIS